jgi:hypothetical protein
MAKMAATKETKRIASPDVQPLSPQSDGGSHTWEWSSTCRAPAATSAIALVATLHGGSHDLSLHASRWGPSFRKLLNGEGIKTLVSVLPGGK